MTNTFTVNDCDVVLYDTLAGHIIAAHGVQGGVKIRLATKTSLPLLSTGTSVNRKPVDVWLKRDLKPGQQPNVEPDLGVLATLTSLKQIDSTGAICLAKFQHVKNRNLAEAMIGLSVYAPAERRAPLANNEYFIADLIGLPVIGESGAEYGKIRAVLEQPANDVYETDQGALIPAVKEFVKQVDIENGRVIVFDVVGLRPEEAEAIISDDTEMEE